MTDDKGSDTTGSSDNDDADDSDWLSRQFDPTSAISQQPDNASGNDSPGTAPAVTPQSADQPGEVQPGASSFSWGLRPSSKEIADAAAAAAPAATPLVPPVTPAVPPVAPPVAEEPVGSVDTDSADTDSADTNTAATDTDAESEADASASDDLDGEPTQAMTIQDVEEVLAPFDRPPDTYPQIFAPAPIAAPAPLPPAAVVPAAPVVPASALTPEPTSQIDKLFGDDRFEEYDDAGVLPTLLAGPATAVPATGDRGSDRPPAERAPMSVAQKRVLWIIGAVVAVLAIVALYLVGMRIGADANEASAETTATPTATATPEATDAPAGPVAPGAYAWDELLGGECLAPFDNAWAETFTVVDCGDDHPAQLVARGELAAEDGLPYPGADKLQKQVASACVSAKVLKYSTARRASDIQLSASFPATEDDWNDGDRTYYCFATRESGKNLSGNLAA